MSLGRTCCTCSQEVLQLLNAKGLELRRGQVIPQKRHYVIGQKSRVGLRSEASNGKKAAGMRRVEAGTEERRERGFDLLSSEMNRINEDRKGKGNGGKA